MSDKLIKLVAKFVTAVTIDRACDASDVYVDDVLADIAALIVKENPEAAAIFKKAIDDGIEQSADNCGESLEDFEPVSQFKIPGV